MTHGFFFSGRLKMQLADNVTLTIVSLTVRDRHVQCANLSALPKWSLKSSRARALGIPGTLPLFGHSTEQPGSHHEGLGERWKEAGDFSIVHSHEVALFYIIHSETGRFMWKRLNHNTTTCIKDYIAPYHISTPDKCSCCQHSAHYACVSLKQRRGQFNTVNLSSTSKAHWRGNKMLLLPETDFWD